MGKLVNLSGKSFGKLTVIQRGKTVKRSKGTIVYWLCVCECGNRAEVVGGDLKSGRTLSCGCYQRRRSKEFHTSHGLCHTRLHEIWTGMKTRCANPKNSHYRHYGGRGITVCKEWQSFEPFYEWAMANGYSDDLTIDRINNDGNYEPNNCRWATTKQQMNNYSRNRLITYDGVTKTMSEWSNHVGLKYSVLCDRMRRNWPIERALFTPQRRHVDGHYIA